jgi:tellurite resistance protein
MTADDVKVFTPLFMVFLTPILGGLTWVANRFSKQIDTKDRQLEESAKAMTELSVKTTLAIEKFTESNRSLVETGKETNRLLTTLIEQQKDTTRSLGVLEAEMNRLKKIT